jgi:anti-sigma B factor antagonist
MRRAEEVTVDDHQRLETRVRQTRDVTVVDVCGEIDLSTATLFAKAVTVALEQARHIVINLRGVTYMDSSGFGTLLSATKRLRPLGGTVHLVGCNDLIARMLQITRLCTVFALHDSEEDALRAIRRTEVPGAAAVVARSAAV